MTDPGRHFLPPLSHGGFHVIHPCRPSARHIALLLGAALLAAASAQTRTHDVEVSDYATLATIDGVALSPDGKQVAYTERRWEGDARNTDIWLVPAAGGAPRRMTFEPGSDAAQRWSPDGKWLYFTSARKSGDGETAPYNGKTQVWRMSVADGSVTPVTRETKGVGAYELAHDGSAIFYAMEGESSEDEWRELREKHADIIETSHGKFDVTTIWKLDLRTWRSEKLVDEKRYVTQFAVSPDGQRIAMLTTPDSHLITNEGWSTVDVYDAATKKVTRLPDKLWREVDTSPYGWLDGLAWSPDGRSLAFGVAWDGYPTEVYVAEWSAAEPAVRKLRRPDGPFVVGGLAWRAGTSDLYFLADHRARQRIFKVPGVRDGKQGEAEVVTGGDVCVRAFSLPRAEGSIAVVMTRPFDDTNVFLVTGDATNTRYEQLSDANPQIATWKLPQMSIVSWNAPDGASVEGLLELPPDYKPGSGPLPTIVDLHGGPTAATLYEFRFWGYGRTIFPAKGYAVFSPNYRGSTGYGDKFLVDLVGRENDVEVKDILAGVDAMVARGIADPERLGVIGWSNGGFLTNCLITTTTRFKAASSGAGVLDQFMQWGIEDTPGHVINYMKGLPWQMRDAYLAASPAYKLGSVTTPTLIHVGRNDPRVPVQHSRSLYRGLRHYAKVPTMLLEYPGEGHGLSKANQRMAKMEWDLAWFEKYVLGASPAPRPTGAATATGAGQ